MIVRCCNEGPMRPSITTPCSLFIENKRHFWYTFEGTRGHPEWKVFGHRGQKCPLSLYLCKKEVQLWIGLSALKIFPLCPGYISWLILYPNLVIMSTNSSKNSIGERLKILIDVLGLKQKDFAREAGIPYKSLRHYIEGTSLPGSENLQKIILKFGVNINWLLTGEGEMFIKNKPRGEIFDDLTMKIVLLAQQLNEDDRREILHYLQNKKQIQDLKKEVEELKKRIKVE